MIHFVDCRQGSPAWQAARRGRPTASMFHAVLAKGRGDIPSKTRSQYMLTLALERITGRTSETYCGEHMIRGHQLEPAARRQYALEREVTPRLIGFIHNGEAGCSPDGLIDSNGLIEIKTKAAHLQTDVLQRNRLPPQHVAQCQGQLWISEREWVDFVAYSPGLPLFVKRVYRDESYIKRLNSAVNRFVDELTQLVETLR